MSMLIFLTQRKEVSKWQLTEELAKVFLMLGSNPDQETKMVLGEKSVPMPESLGRKEADQ